MAGWAGGGWQGGLGFSWRAGPAQRGHACQSAPALQVAPELQDPAQGIHCQLSARYLGAAHPHSLPPLLLPRLGHRDQAQLSDRLKFPGILPPLAPKNCYLCQGPRDSAKWSGLQTGRRQQEKVRVLPPGAHPCPQCLTMHTSPMTAIGVSPLAWATRCSIR